MEMKEKDCIYFSEYNIHGALVVYGIIGIHQYYDFSKEMAYRLYVEECRRSVFFND
ncbi:MAG: hypothetical protein KBS91_04185 [Firmicutes bacterium]|nr:hypothetical protein [Candidatus Caballimonas caccae]